MKLESFRQLIVKWQLFLITGVAGILLVLGSYYYYHSEELRIKEEKHSTLKAVADLKADDISQFIKERRADLMTFAEGITIRDNLRLWIKTNNEEAKEKLIYRMSLAKKYYDYENVFITTPSGTILLSLDSITTHDPLALTFCIKVNELQDAEFSDLYFCPIHKTIHFDFISPVRNEQHVIIALIILRVNPGRYLYPLLQSWPTQSKSSEVLLVQKDGNEVLYLNELKFQKNTALKFRLPLTRNDLPAVQAVLGFTGVFEGKDYRGVDVLSDLRPIPGTRWFMICKIDQAEIYSEVKYRAIIIFLIATIILLLLGTGLAWLYSTRQKNIFEQLYRVKSALRQTQEEFKITLYSIGDAVITTNLDSLVLMMNPVAEQLTGLKEQEAKGKPLDEVFKIIHEESREKVESPVQQVIEQGLVVGLANHTLLISKDGKEIPIADSGAPVRDQHKKIIGVVLVFRDQTEERAAQKSLRESEDKFRTLLMASSDSIYRMSPDWTVMYELDGRGFIVDTLKPNSEWFQEYIPPVDQEHVMAVIQEAIRTRSFFELEHRVWLVDGSFGWTFSRAIPRLDVNGDIFEWFGAASEITDRKRAEEETHETRAKLQTALDSMTDAVFISDTEGNFIDFNEAFATFHKFKNKAECARTLVEYPEFLEVYLPNGVVAPLEMWAVPRALRGEIVTNAEYGLKRKDTGEYWVGSYSFSPVRDSNNKIVGSVVVGRDITEKKETEDKIHEQLDELRRWYVVTLDREGRVLELKQEVNELLKQFGKPLRYGSPMTDDPDVE